MIDNALLQLLVKAYAPGTIRNIRSAMRVFLQFMINHKLQIFPPSTINIATFYAHLVNRVSAMGTLSNYQSAVSNLYKLYGYQVDTGDIIFRLLNMAAKKSLTTIPAAKPPLELEHIINMSQIIDWTNPTHVAFLNAVSVGFMATLRRSNICPPSVKSFDPTKHLCRQDIVFTPEGMVVVLKWSKTNQDGAVLHKIPIAYSGLSYFDPPAQFRQFVDRFPVKPTDPCFSFYHNQRLFVLTHNDLSSMLNRFLTATGVPAAAYTTHSIRKGGGVDHPQNGYQSGIIATAWDMAF